MRQLDPGLRAHLDGECTTLCFCWKLTRTDGVILGFTDHDRQIQFDGTNFEALAGFEGSAAEAALGLNIDTQEVAGAFSSNLLREEDLAAGRYDNARVETWIVNWNDIFEREFLRVGFLGEITREDSRFMAEFRSLTNQLDQTSGRRYMPLCDADLGDGQCGVDLQLPAFKAVGTVSDPRGRTIFDASGLGGFDEGWFVQGRLYWTSGDNQGLAVEVSDNSAVGGATRVQMWKPIPFDINVGDTFEITAGCNKCFDICKNKFANHLNFRGFPHMPGNDFSLRYADQNDQHDGSPLVL